MTGFVIAAAALVLAVLGFVLRPLWRPRLALGGVLVLSLACIVGLLYVLIGTPQALDPAQRKAVLTVQSSDWPAGPENPCQQTE